MKESITVIEAQVINQALNNIAIETGIVLQNSAFSPNIRDRLDFSSAVMDFNGHLIAQAEHIPVHLGSMSESVKSIVNYIGIDTLQEGDIYITNNPYFGGTHLPDITVVKPIYHEKEHVGYIANRCHHADVGGKIPGSMPSGKYTLEEEGFIINPTILERRGKINQQWFKDFLNAVRVPEERKGDIQAQLASTKVGEKKFHEILEKYSLKKVQSVVDFLIERSKRATIDLIRTIDDSKTWSFTDYMDDDGVKANKINITAEVSKKDDQLCIDFSNTHPQVDGNINAPYAVTYSAVYYIIRCLISRDYATNHGLYAPLKIITKKGTLVDPLPPNGVAAGNVETSQRITDVLLGVFAKIFPESIPAASGGTMNNITIGGSNNANGKKFTYYETIASGIGAAKNYTPPHAKHSHMTNTRNTSIEVLERYYPLRVVEYTILENSGGKGKWSGSNGVRRSIKLLTDEAILSIQSERRIFAPFGISGGKDGQKGRNILLSDDKEQLLPSKITTTIKKGDVIVIETSGGCGYCSADN